MLYARPQMVKDASTGPSPSIWSWSF